MRQQYLKLRSIFQNARWKNHLEIGLYFTPVHFTDTGHISRHFYTLYVKNYFVANFKVCPMGKVFFYRNRDVFSGCCFADPGTVCQLLGFRKGVAESNTVFVGKYAMRNFYG